MTDPLTELEPQREPAAPRGRDRGQIVLLFAGAMVVILGMAGLLIDGGFLLSAQRQAQAAADTSALAAAKAASTGGNAASAARSLAATNGYAANLVDCDGATQANQGVVVNRPPLSGMFVGDSGYVEVITSRAEETMFAPALGMPCFVVRARAVALISSTTVATCNFCSLSGWADHYTLLLDNGNDLRIDGDLRSSQDTWYSGTMAVNRCGSTPCSAPTCGDWNPGPGEHRILMCGQSLYVDHSGGATPTTLSARTISVNGGWQARSENDIVHADELGAVCPAHPRNLHYPPALQETNVCIGVPPLADPLNDPSVPSSIMPEPDYAALSTCGGPPFCGPVASATCTAEPGSTLRLPTGTLAAPNKLTVNNAGKSTICPGLYFGGFATNGDNGPQPHIIMLPGTYVMVGGGFSVTGTASITSVSSRGDGVTIYNSGGQEAFAENFPSNPGIIPTTCPPPIGSTCSSAASTILNPPSTASRNVGVAIPYKLTVMRGSGLLVPTGDATAFEFYNGSDPIACEGGIIVASTSSALAATCTTRYTSFGNKGITAVYLGDSVYEPSGDMKNQVITAQPGNALDNVLLNTNDATASCAVPPCGVVQLHAPTTGRYSGLLIFQQRAPGINQGNVGIEIDPRYGVTDPNSNPDSGAPVSCTGDWMTAGVPPDVQDVPEPCGALGGLSGTIYAPHVASGGPSDWDAVVNIRASGLANLQIISAEIHFTEVGNQARFAYDPSMFANGAIRLVE